MEGAAVPDRLCNPCTGPGQPGAGQTVRGRGAASHCGSSGSTDGPVVQPTSAHCEVDFSFFGPFVVCVGSRKTDWRRFSLEAAPVCYDRAIGSAFSSLNEPRSTSAKDGSALQRFSACASRAWKLWGRWQPGRERVGPGLGQGRQGAWAGPPEAWHRCKCREWYSA